MQYTLIWLVCFNQVYLISGAIPSHVRYNSLWIDDEGELSLPAGGFCHISHLTKISIYRTPIRNISREAFQCLNRLEDLILRQNGITHLPSGVFKPLHNLIKLYIFGE